MTNPEASPAARYALFSSGANFSLRVLEQLQARGLPPDLLVSPEYPPARIGAASIQFEAPRRISGLADDIELAYAPADRQQACAELLRQRSIDYALVACWPYLIGPALRQGPREAMLNLHPSLLPRYRGPDPLQAQLAGAEKHGGVTLHLLDERFDHGPIVAQSEFEIKDAERDRTVLEQRCAVLGAALFIDALRAGRGAWRCRRQSA